MKLKSFDMLNKERNTRYELSFYTIRKIENTDDLLEGFSYKSMAILEAHYIKNRCFLSEDFIMNNIDKIKNIKTTIVQGRYDFICPPAQAFRLHAGLNNSTLNVVIAGHSSSDPEIKKKLKSELKRITSWSNTDCSFDNAYCLFLYANQGLRMVKNDS